MSLGPQESPEKQESEDERRSADSKQADTSLGNFSRQAREAILEVDVEHPPASQADSARTREPESEAASASTAPRLDAGRLDTLHVQGRAASRTPSRAGCCNAARPAAELTSAGGSVEMAEADGGWGGHPRREQLLKPLRVRFCARLKRLFDI